MSQYDSLRSRTNQHLPKNSKSKADDKDVYKAMQKVKEYIKGKPEFSSYFVSEWDIDFEKALRFLI